MAAWWHSIHCDLKNSLALQVRGRICRPESRGLYLSHADQRVWPIDSCILCWEEMGIIKGGGTCHNLFLISGESRPWFVLQQWVLAQALGQSYVCDRLWGDWSRELSDVPQNMTRSSVLAAACSILWRISRGKPTGLFQRWTPVCFSCAHSWGGSSDGCCLGGAAAGIFLVGFGLKAYEFTDKFGISRLQLSFA